MSETYLNPRHRSALLSLGVPSEAIRQLDPYYLRAASRYLAREPRRNDDRKELQSTLKALRTAKAAIEALLPEPSSGPMPLSARRFISGGGQRHSMGGLRLHETSQSLDAAIGVLMEAIAAVPKAPVRHRDADPYPVELIHRALLDGFMHAGCDPEAIPIQPSISPGSAFRELVGLCYEAMGRQTVDPERAIRAYMEQWRAQQAYAATLKARTEPSAEQ